MTTWTITNLECAPAVGELVDVVRVVHWFCIDGAASVYGSATLPAPLPEAFVPFATLTEATILDWLWANGVDQAATEAAVAAELDRLANPPIITKPLPWEGA